MRFMAIKRGFPLLVAAFLALALAACSSSSGVKSERDDALDRVAELEGLLATAEMERDAANDEVTRLMGELGTATDEVTRLMGELGMANDEVTRLTGELGTATGDVSRLEGELGTANDEVTRLMGELQTAMDTIGDPGDAPDENGSLHAQLNAANARIAELEAGTAPDQVDPIKTAAGQAASDANDAYMAASTAADEAEAADDNRATMQTGDANSVYDAMMARTAANAAMKAAADAQTAATAAMAAGNVNDATGEKAKADMARDAAMEAQTAAEGHRDDAVMAAAAELKIDGTVKSVGDTSIDATAARSVVTTDGVTEDTGLQIEEMQPMEEVAATEGAAAVAATADAAYVAPKAGAAIHTLTLGKTVDSANDMARLMIISQYAGSKTVKVYASDIGSDAGDVEGHKAGYLSIDDTATTDVVETNNVRLRSAGMYYIATDDNDTLTPSATTVVAEDAKADHVYWYVSTPDDPETPATNEEVRTYLVLTSEATVTEGGETTTTYTYSPVDIHAPAINHDDDTDTPDITPEVTGTIPEATDYQHIHFGVWAALEEAAKGGSHGVSGHGIGFVQNYSGSGLTGADMPNHGTATYNGNWVATVQAADVDGNGDITLEHDTAIIDANFGDGEITAKLMNLATLEGDIAGNSFSGTKAEATGGGLDASADFEGSFSGGFYGAKGAEVGGVFDFASDDGNTEGGAFRGAFGGQ